MLKPVLTICIPTYNRPKTLSESLERITAQLHDGVEVLIVDDGSNLETREVAAHWQSKKPDQIRFEKNEHNLGFDRNLLKCIEQARGKYCWFMSDDDLIKPGAIEKVLSLINNGEADKLIFLNYSKFDTNTNQVLEEHMIGLNHDEKFESAENFFFKPTPNSYLKYLGKNLMYMSISVFPREYWLEYAPECQKFIGTNFIHLFIILSMIVKKNLPIYFVLEAPVLYRTGDQRIWPNHIWLTYHTKLLQHAKSIGLPKNRIRELQIQYFISYRRALIMHFIRKILGMKQK